jgi:hypothetical protein
MSTSLKNQLAQEIEALNDSQLAELLDSARRMNRRLPPAMSGEEFVDRFSGLIPPSEVIAMEKEIEEAFEQIEADERPLPS